MLNYKLYFNSSSNNYILLLHCICGNMDVFKNQLDNFKKLYNVILVDLPYHGNSKQYNKDLTFYNISNDIISILDKHNIKKVIIIGLSLGSCVANYLLYYFSDRVEKLILSSTANGLSNIFLEKLFSIFTKINILIPTNIYLKILIYFIIPQKNNVYFRKNFYYNGKNMEKNNLRKYLKLLNEHFKNYRTFLKDYINNSKIPKIYLMGENDYIFKKCIKKNIAYNKYNEVIFFPNMSHMLDIDKNDSFSKNCINLINH